MAQTSGLGFPSFMMTFRWSLVIKLTDNQHVWTKYLESCSLTSKSCYLSWPQILLEPEGSALDQCSKQVDQMELRWDFSRSGSLLSNKKCIPSPCSVTIILPFWILVRWRFLHQEKIKMTASTRSTWWLVRMLIPSRDKVFSVYLHQTWFEREPR